MFILDGSCGWLPENTMLLIHNLYNIVRFLIPVLIVIMGAMDFVKSIASANNDAIRKNTNAFVQKLIAAAIAFIIPATVNQIAKVIGDNYSSNAMVCVNQILNGEYKASEGLHVTDPVPKPKEDNKKDDNQKEQQQTNSNCDETHLSGSIELCKTTFKTYSDPHEWVEKTTDGKNCNLIGPELAGAIGYSKEVEDCYNKYVQKPYNTCVENAKKSWCN